MDWDPPVKPTELAENRLISAILDGQFAPGSLLPAERELADQIGVTRPTLREALQRMARDGWIEIHHGRSTRVRDFWQEGSLGVLGAIAQRPEHLPLHFVEQLLTVRLGLAPDYTRLAVEHAPGQVLEALTGLEALEDTPAAFASADWRVHHALTVASGNPIYTLILNGFRDLYQVVGAEYFTPPAARRLSRDFYQNLRSAVDERDAEKAASIVREVMLASLEHWRSANRGGR